ncbi:transcription factor [Asimina triloba]
MNSGRSSSLKIMFALRFLGALARIHNRQRTSCSKAATDVVRRSKRIKLAADASMASAVGSKREWSRALQRKFIRSRRISIHRPKSTTAVRPKRILKALPPSQPLTQADKLRRLLPGGMAMDFCSLLDETASYIQSLTTQVKVMQNIADSFCL